MKAKVIKAFPGRPDNEISTREIKEGEIIDGDLADVAVSEGWAEEEKPADKKDVEATEDDVVAYLKGLDPKPESKPKVADVGKAMDKKVSGETLKAAWKTFETPAS